jgi:nucleoside-diphosphate-sugar epimerase
MRGRIRRATSSIEQKPDGIPRKLRDSSRILQLGWRPTIPLDQGLSQTYRWFLDQRELQTV